MRTASELARHMQPSLSGARLDRQWDGVSKRIEGRSRRPWLAAGIGVSVACAVAALVLLSWPASKPVVLEGAVVETEGQSSQRLTLADGSRVEVAEESRLEFASVRSDAIHLVLGRGSLALDVTHDDNRSFVVSAAGFDVIVRGTRFSVALEGEPSRLTIFVDEGRVETRRAGSREPGRAIGAGESWSTAVGATAIPPPVAVPTPRAKKEEHEPEAEAAQRESEPAPARRGADRFSELVREQKYVEAYESLGPGGFTREIDHAGARRLLELANAARLGGHPREAARALDTLRRKYPGDSRAGLAALELGRLRMDSLGDPAGALEAFEEAVKRTSSGAVREDAEARRVQVFEVLGDRGRCIRARDAYLARFPRGIHAARMQKRCVSE